MKRLTFNTAVFLVSIFISGCISIIALAEAKDNNFSSGRVVYIDQAQGFVVINLGSQDGLTEGRLFDVYRNDITIGKIKAAKIRKKFSAADIESIDENESIIIGDCIEPSKGSAEVIKPRKKEPRKEPSGEKIDEILMQAKRLIKDDDYKRAEEKIHEVLDLDSENKKALKMLNKIKQVALHRRTKQKADLEKMLNKTQRYALRKKLDQLFKQAQAYLKDEDYIQAELKLYEILKLDSENRKARKMLDKIERLLRPRYAGTRCEPIVLNINAPKDVILSSTIDVFRKYGCIVTFSDPVKYNLEASKELKLPFLIDIANEWGSWTRSKMYYSAEVTQAPGANRLSIYLEGAYDKDSRIYNHKVKIGSPGYREAQEMASKIKDLSER